MDTCTMSNPWILRRDCCRFWQAAYVQDLIVKLFHYYQKSVAEAHEDQDDETSRKSFLTYYESISMKSGDSRSILYQSQLVFDETVWPPDDDVYMKRGVLFLKFSPVAEYFIFRINFTEPMEEAIELGSCEWAPDIHWIPTNIFDVHFLVVE